MPAYDFICDACGHTFSDLHDINEPHPVKCPSCKKSKVRLDWKRPPAYHANYSPFHPRKNRGRGH